MEHGDFCPARAEAEAINREDVRESVGEPNAMLAYVPFPGFWQVIPLASGVETLGNYTTKDAARAAAAARGYVLA